MDLNEVRYIIAKFTDKLDAPEEFDVRLNFGQAKNFAVEWGKIMATPPELRDFSAVRPFKTILGGQNPPMVLNQGNQYAYAELPTDYFGKESGTVFYGGQEMPIDFLEDAEFDYRKRNYIEVPTAEYPIGNIQSNFIRFLPKTLQTVNFSYIHTPLPIHFAYTTNRGFIEYDPSNSSELLWDDENIYKIISYVLQDMGLQVTPEQVKAKK